MCFKCHVLDNKVPFYLQQIMAGEDFGSTERKSLPDGDSDKALNLDTVWNFEVKLTIIKNA